MRDKRPMGVWILGILLAVTSLLQLSTAMTYGRIGYYKQLFEPMPETVIFIRYIVSVTLRVLGLAAGIGLLWRREAARRAVLFIGCFTVLTIYWKHPLFAFKKHAQLIADFVARSSCTPEVALPQSVHMIALLSAALTSLIDLGFAVCLVYYFTRPAVKTWFRKAE